MKVTVMGLGVHGGGLASALFFARRGATVTVTDLRSRDVLKPSIEKLADFPVRFVLERHEKEDFEKADLVIKNPAVPPGSPFLKTARDRGVAIETDLSIFLSLAKNPVIAVTGSKGKSTTASAIAFGLSRIDPRTRLGGNITVSPLTFLEELDPATPVVLELSSWQLGDLKGKGILAPSVSAFTVILPDHLDKYTGMAEYVADKKVMFEAQGPDGKAVFNYDDPWQREFPHETRARSFHYSSKALPPGLPGAWLEGSEGKAKTTLGHGPSKTILSSARIPGDHNRMNLLCAGLALALFGVKAEVVRKALAEFPGVEHRLELFLQWRGIRFYNDSAATIPHATVRALKTVEQPVVLIAGGTDKNIDFSPLAEVARVPHAVVLLDGTATPKIRSVLEAQGAACEGPFGDLREAVEAAVSRANEEGCILFSPGCASFGMFVNEFDRGRKFKETAAGLAAEDRAARG